MLWTGPAEAGDTKFFVSRGYVHVIGNPRGIGKSEAGGSRAFDGYDLIEWIAAQPWCDGNVGMVGISGFGAEQLMAAKLKPPHLKAIFPFDSRGAYGEAGGFRDEYPGGVIHLFRFLLQVYASAHQQKGQPKALPPAREKLWAEAIANPDFRMYPHIYNVLALKGEHFPIYFDILIDPYDKVAAVEKSEAEFSKIEIPTYTGSGWYGYTYKLNWIVILKDVGPDVGVQTAREGERDVPPNLHERELTRGWLKASHRALDPKRSKPWRPWHPLTREAHRKVTAGEITEYAIEIMATANAFKRGHRICLEITSLDLATGVGGAHNVEYIPYHICSSKTVLHRIYHDPQHPSHLLLPVIPNA